MAHSVLSLFSKLMPSFFSTFSRPAAIHHSAQHEAHSAAPQLTSSKSLVARAFIHDIAMSSDWNSYFCGHCPVQILSLCLKYLEMDSTFHLNPSVHFQGRYAVDSEYAETDSLSIECVSAPFGARPKGGSVDIEGLSFCIYVGFENATESESEWDSYSESPFAADREDEGIHELSDCVDISGMIQLLTVPESVESVTVNYKFRAYRLGMEWQQIVTMRPDDVVGPPAVTLDAADSIHSEMPLVFDCRIEVLLIDGVPVTARKHSK